MHVQEGSSMLTAAWDASLGNKLPSKHLLACPNHASEGSRLCGRGQTEATANVYTSPAVLMAAEVVKPC